MVDSRQKRIDKEVGRRKALEERFADRERALDQINTLSAEVGAIKTRNAADAQAAEGTLQAKLHSGETAAPSSNVGWR